MQRDSLGKRLWGIFSPFLIYFAVSFVVEMIVLLVAYAIRMPAMIDSLQTMDDFMNAYMEICMEVLQYAVELTALSALITIPILEWMRRRDRKRELAAGIVQNRKAPAAKYFLIAGICIPFSLGLNNLIMLSNLAAYSDAYQDAAETLYAPSFGVQILCAGIIIPIVEEYIFRGLVYRRMRAYVSVRRAIIVSAVLFGVYHGNLVQMIYGVLCGILLAWLYEKYGSLWAPVLAHMLMNLVSVILTNVDAFLWMFADLMRVGIITVVCAALTSTMYVLIREIDEKPESYNS